MTTRKFFSALLLISILFSVASCEKSNPEPAPADRGFTVPEGSRIIIHFGTSTQRGCMYSFSNCIWIGWGNAVDLNRQHYTLQFNDPASTEPFGQFFPLVAECSLAPQNGLPAQTLQPGFYRFELDAAGRKQISFDPNKRIPVTSLVNPNNPQDNLGQLHNLAIEAILDTDTRAAMKAAGYDIAQCKKVLAAKTVQFLKDQADVVIGSSEQQLVEKSGFSDGYDKHSEWLKASKLSLRDQQTLLNILDMADGMPVESPAQLSQFVAAMTDAETVLANDRSAMDNPHMVLSAISIAKHSRYYWFWKNYSQDTTAQRADWWKADVKGLIEGGIVQAIIDSVIAALK
jgi:hypothetical protein